MQHACPDPPCGLHSRDRCISGAPSPFGSFFLLPAALLQSAHVVLAKLLSPSPPFSTLPQPIFHIDFILFFLALVEWQNCGRIGWGAYEFCRDSAFFLPQFIFSLARFFPLSRKRERPPRWRASRPSSTSRASGTCAAPPPCRAGRGEGTPPLASRMCKRTGAKACGTAPLPSWGALGRTKERNEKGKGLQVPRRMA